MRYLVSYDIVEDKKRTRLAKRLLNFGIRVQYSVFECEVDRKHLKEMLKQTKELIDLKTDSLRIYRLCESCAAKVKSYGIKRGWEDVLEEDKVL